MTNTVTGLKIPLSAIVTKEAYKIPEKYLTTDPKTQKTGLMIEGSDKTKANRDQTVRTGI